MAKRSVQRDPALLLDMLLAARDALSFVADQDQSSFMASALHQYAVIRCLEVIGEAANNVSEATRAGMADVAWTDMINMRHRLIHGYESVNLDQVWQTVRDDLAPLIARLEPLIPDECEMAKLPL
jgi:uncharacterized protein with HEPN domain